MFCPHAFRRLDSLFTLLWYVVGQDIQNKTNGSIQCSVRSLAALRFRTGAVTPQYPTGRMDITLVLTL